MGYLTSTGGVSAFKALDDEGNWHYLKKGNPDLYKVISETTSIADAKKVIKDRGMTWKNFNKNYQVPRRDMLTGNFLTDWSGKTIEPKEEPPQYTGKYKEQKTEFFATRPSATIKDWLNYKAENIENW